MTMQINELKGEVSYNQETGVFVRLIGTRRAAAGKIAGTKTTQGYIKFQIDNREYYAHRLAWLFVHGHWPIGDVDHIDGNKSNNKISNLRDVSRSINLQNLKSAKTHNRSSGLLGVSYHKQTNKFRASIRANQKNIHLGLFDTPQNAHAAYVQAKRQLHTGNML